MKFGIRTLDEIDVNKKTVLLRVDINEPVDKEQNKVKDTTRIEACIPTIKELSKKGAKVVVLAHQGSDIEYKNYYTLLPQANILKDTFGNAFSFVEDVCGPTAQQAIKQMQDGDILLLDNVRFMAEEQTLFELNLQLTHEEQAKTLVVSKLAPLGDIYVCDAFAAAHRDQPTLCGFEQILPSAMGRLFEQEYTVISELMEQPERPCVFILGGSKINDAFKMMQTALQKGTVDKVLTGGLVGEVLNWAAGDDIGQLARDFICKQGYEDLVEVGKELLDKYSNKIMRPVDFGFVVEGTRQEGDVNALPDGVLVLDIGAKTAEMYTQEILKAKTVFVNGPMGVFEEEVTEYGTKAVWDALASTQGYSVIGGGDSITATNKYGKANDVGYICTAGGALIRFLSGEELPVVKALRHGSTLV